MKSRHCPRASHGRFPWMLVVLLWLPAAEARAALQDIDFATCAATPPAAFTINASVGTPLAGQSIGLLNGSGNVFWAFSPPPSAAGCIANIDDQSYTCKGVTVALPASPETPVPHTDDVTVSGTPTSSGSFSFTLQAAAEGGTPSCSREYHVVITAPFDLVFVLDRSGSMNEPSAPGTRWDALKTGVNGFTPILSSTAIASPSSRFGLSLFATDVLAHNSFPAGMVVIDGTLANNVNTEINSQTPSGWTAMGGGLKNGIAKMTDPSRPRVVVLFTDGEQTPEAVGPLVNGDGCGFSDGTTVNPGCPATSGVKIVTVGVGNPSGSYLTTLQNLAHKNRGSSIITANGTSFTAPGDCTGTIDQAFTCAIQPALSGNSPQMVASSSGALSGTVSVPAFDLNRFVDQLLIRLTLNRRFETPQLLSFLGGVRILRNGTDVTSLFQPVIVGSFSDSLLLRGVFPLQNEGVPNPPLPPEGSYVVQLQAPSNLPASLSYRMVAFADDHRLGVDWHADPSAPRVGEPFRPSMNLSWLGRPLTNATVQAVILKPGDDLGDALAKNALKVVPSSAPDAGSPGYQKYLALLKDPAFLAQLLPLDQQLTLTHRGEGIYSAAFDPGDVSGVYQVIYRVAADDPAFGKVQRLAAQSVYVRFGEIDLSTSAVSTAVVGGATTLNFRPRTTFGRFVGPANASAISVSGAPVTSITDHQDGRYTVVLAAAPETPIEVSVLDEEIYEGPAIDFGSGGGPGAYEFALSLHAGLTDPWSGLSTPVGGDLMLEFDVERPLSNRLSLNAVLGRYSFDPDPDVLGATLYLRGYVPRPGFRLFAEVGAGLYDGDNLNLGGGLSGGIGLDRALGGQWRGEIGVHVFGLFQPGTNVKFLTYKVGVRRTF